MYNNDLPKRSDLPSSKQLLRSTLIAAVVACVLLATVVLPSEYGIDPTGIGRVLGLTKMGEIKTQLAQEAEQDRLATQQSSPVAQTPQIATQPATSSSSDASAVTSATPSAIEGSRADEMSITLQPGEGAEIKLLMLKGGIANYEWTTTGGPVNHETHGDGPGGANHSFSKGKQVERDAGTLTAPFNGQHGWFWRNRTQSIVTIKLSTKGQYQNIKRLM